jgi:predicted TPR repeat methyltransferase
MVLTNPFRKLLCVPGVQYLTTRLGGATLRRWSFDEKFRTGEWNFASAPDSELVQVLEKYARGGHVLMLGCGTGSIAGALRDGSFDSFLGVDLSPEAVKRANSSANHRIRFQVGDMLRFTSSQKFSTILFSESLYYIKPWQRRRLMLRAANMLSARGRMIVTVAQPARFSRMLEMLRNIFAVDEDRRFTDSGRWLIVLRNKEAGGRVTRDDMAR